MDAPSLYTDSNLEQFDTKSEVTETGAQGAKKVFEYTFLGRGPLSLKTRDLSLAYFDPASGRYVEKKISIPGIEVSGTAAPASGSGSQTQTKDKDQAATSENDFLSKMFAPSESKVIEKNVIGLVGPVFKNEDHWFSRWFDIFNVILGLVILAVLGNWYFVNKNVLRFGSNGGIKKEISNMKSKGLNYSDLYKVVSLLDKQNKMANGGVSILQVIDESLLSKEGKTYFKNALLVCEEKTFAINKADKKIIFEGRYFKEILKNINGV
jgi:hypothetical protein